MPKISVIISLYNKELYVEKTIDSILKQTYDDYEAIIVDDGSTDESVNIIKTRYSSDKIKIYSKQNGGPSSARNYGVRKAQGEWVVFLDADDMLLPYALDHFMSLIENNKGLKYFVCNYYIGSNSRAKLFSLVKHNGILKHPFFLEATRELTERAGSSIISRDLALKYPFNENFRRYEDAECQYNIMRNEIVYQSSVPVMISDRDSCGASFFRKDYREDFICFLDFDRKSFWEQMCLYLLALECKSGYPEQSGKYRKIYFRVDMMIAFLIVRIRNKLRNLWFKLFSNKDYSYEFLLSQKSFKEVK